MQLHRRKQARHDDDDDSDREGGDSVESGQPAAQSDTESVDSGQPAAQRDEDSDEDNDGDDDRDVAKESGARGDEKESYWQTPALAADWLIQHARRWGKLDKRQMLVTLAPLETLGVSFRAGATWNVIREKIQQLVAAVVDHGEHANTFMRCTGRVWDAAQKILLSHTTQYDKSREQRKKKKKQRGKLARQSTRNALDLMAWVKRRLPPLPRAAQNPDAKKESENQMHITVKKAEQLRARRLERRADKASVSTQHTPPSTTTTPPSTTTIRSRVTFTQTYYRLGPNGKTQLMRGSREVGAELHRHPTDPLRVEALLDADPPEAHASDCACSTCSAGAPWHRITTHVLKKPRPTGHYSRNHERGANKEAAAAILAAARTVSENDAGVGRLGLPPILAHERNISFVVSNKMSDHYWRINGYDQSTPVFLFADKLPRRVSFRIAVSSPKSGTQFRASRMLAAAPAGQHEFLFTGQWLEITANLEREYVLDWYRSSGESRIRLSVDVLALCLDYAAASRPVIACAGISLPGILEPVSDSD